MGVRKGVKFVYPFRGKNREWEVIDKVRNRWRAEIVEGQFAGRKADFDESHIARIVHLAKVLQNLPVGKIAKGNIHR